MTERMIVTIGQPVLRRRAVEVSAAELASAAVQELIDDLVTTMRSAHGAGLGAPQIGSSLRIAVLEVDRNSPSQPSIPLTVIVNPILTPVDDEVFRNNEGCGSVPDLRGDVDRFVRVRARYLDRDGRAHDEIRVGLTAAMFQHECDHLDGVLFVDRVTDPASFSMWEQFGS